jgi:DNA-binding response OmpR family regulator
VAALTRRRGEVVIERLQFGDISLNTRSAELSCGAESVQLSKKEFEVLKMFLYNPKMTITKDAMIINVWGVESDATDNNVEVYISFLRKKLKFLKSKVTIRNIQRIGYRLEAGDD